MTIWLERLPWDYFPKLCFQLSQQFEIAHCLVPGISRLQDTFYEKLSER